jgi:SAM-dependent methyltransferase
MSQDFYTEPVVYDVLHTPGTAAEVAVMLRIWRRWGDLEQPDPLWLEPACGTGRYLRLLQRRGLRTVGFDRSQPMLDYAARRLDSPASRESAGCLLFRADLTDFSGPAAAAGLRPGSVACACNLVNSLRHLPGDRAMLNHFEQMVGILRPGALYVIGISLTDYDRLEPEEDVWTGTRGRLTVRQVVNYLPPEPGTGRGRQERVISHLVVERPRGSEHHDHVYDLRCYNQDQWDRLVAATDLVPVASCDAAGRPREGRTLPYQLEVLAAP